MNCLENFYVQQFQLQGSLLDEQSVGEMNPCILSSLFHWFKIWTVVASFGAFAVVWLGIPFVWDMTLCD